MTILKPCNSEDRPIGLRCVFFLRHEDANKVKDIQSPMILDILVDASHANAVITTKLGFWTPMRLRKTRYRIGDVCKFDFQPFSRELLTRQ